MTAPSAGGRFITLEGIDGAGKSSHVEALAAQVQRCLQAPGRFAGSAIIRPFRAVRTGRVELRIVEVRRIDRRIGIGQGAPVGAQFIWNTHRCVV